MSSFYRVLRERGLLRHRNESRPAQRRGKREQIKANGPGQVYSWDVTYLFTRVREMYLFLSMLMDVWSRKIVAWGTHDRESEEYAREFFRRVAARENLDGRRLHADNGNAMKAQTVFILQYSLGLDPSFKRPRVSEIMRHRNEVMQKACTHSLATGTARNAADAGGMSIGKSTVRANASKSGSCHSSPSESTRSLSRTVPLSRCVA